MITIDRLLQNIKADEKVVLIAYYGSRAGGTETTESDVDLIVVIDDMLDGSVQGLHYQDITQTEIDFLIISEDSVHSNDLSEYMRRCILSQFRVIYNTCETCLSSLSSQEEEPNRKLVRAEAENIYWHLRHIIYKAFRYDKLSPERLVLWSKFVYYLVLLWPRFYDQDVVGEIAALKIDSNKMLRGFLSRNADCIPPVEMWEEFLINSPIGREMKHEKLFFEVSDLIQPYRPINGSHVCNDNLKKYINKWITM